MRIFDPTDKLGFPHNLRAETKKCFLDELPDHYDLELAIGDEIIFKKDGQNYISKPFKKTVISVRELKQQTRGEGEFGVPYKYQNWDENGQMTTVTEWPGLKSGRFGKTERQWFQW